MLTKTKKVYYCEFCKKKGLSAGAIKEHEKHCTGNIKRQCRMCGNTPDYEDEVKKYTERIKTEILQENANEKLNTTKDDIRDGIDTCPACTLTILRQLSKILPPWLTFNYKYKEDVVDWWKERNAEFKEK